MSSMTRLHVRPVLQDHLRHVLVADVAHAAVAADDPDLRQLEDLLVGHHRVAEVHVLVVLARVDDVVRRGACSASASRSGITDRRP